MEQYVITGIGVYNGLGTNAETSWKNLLDGKSAIKPIDYPEDDDSRFPETYTGIQSKVSATSPHPLTGPDHITTKWRHWDKNTKSCLLSVDEAINDAKLTSKNVGTIISTFGGGTDVRLDFFSALNKGKRKVSPRTTLNMGLDFPAAQVANIYGVIGPNTAMDSACTTGLSSIDTAVNMLRCDNDLDAVIVGGSDHTTDPIYLYWFQSLGALGTHSAPFDKNRDGFIMGEGAAAMIIEPLSKALARGAKIYSIIKGLGFVTMFDSDTSPDPKGKGARAVVRKALKNAQVDAEQINLVNAHATSTPCGDLTEFEAMSEITPGITMVSNKGQIGHTMAVSGIIETIYTIQSMRDSIVPGNANLKVPCGDTMSLPTQCTKLNVKYAIKNSFGFGGRNASLILERYDR